MSAPQESVFQQPRFPPPVRAVLNAWKGFERLGVGRVSLAEASLLAAARRSSGLHHFVDESFRAAMRRMLTSLEEEAHLHPLGRLAMRQILVRTLVNRLRLEALCDRHPEIAELPVAAPVFIVGLQRTGTTLLHRLLTCEPTLRPLLSWEALNPAPFPGRHRRDPRIRQAERMQRGLRYLAPEFFAIHPVEALAPEWVISISWASSPMDIF